MTQATLYLDSARHGVWRIVARDGDLALAMATHSEPVVPGSWRRP